MQYRMFTRISAVLLAALMLSATACSSTTMQETETQAPVSIDTTDTEPVETNPPHNLPELDFEDAEYRIAMLSEGSASSICVEETNGEVVNDAIYNRAAKVMEDYNFRFNMYAPTPGDFNKFTNYIGNMVYSGDDACELVYGHVVGTCNNAVRGDYFDLYQIAYLDFTQPWWPTQSVEEMTVYNRMFTICSAINNAQLASGKVVFFNKELLTDFNRDLPYEWVRNGEWTMDRLIEETSSIYQDTNGDGKKDNNDTYGYTSQPVQNGFLTSTNTPVYGFTEDGGREITIMTERCVNLVEKIHAWYYETDGVRLAYDGYMNIFANGSAAYAFGMVGHAVSTYRNTEIIYGMVPQPKYDEDQQNYYIFACPDLFSIPITCHNTDFAGFVFEALTYYGYYDVIPAYYETTLKGKIADQPEDAEMLEIINDALTVSFGYCYDNWEGFAHLFDARLNFSDTRGNKDMASAYKKGKRSAEYRLNKCLDAFLEYES